MGLPEALKTSNLKVEPLWKTHFLTFHKCKNQCLRRKRSFQKDSVDLKPFLVVRDWTLINSLLILNILLKDFAPRGG